MTCEVINVIESIEEYTYLELGVHDNSNFNRILCKDKYSVDVNGRALFKGTTDDFFKMNNKERQFDIIFIDANHDYPYVLRDFNNSIDICNKWVILHDMVPPDRRHTANGLCSDSYKILYYLLTETNLETYTLDNNYGLTFVKMPGVKLTPGSDIENLDYDEFMRFMKSKRLYNNEEIKNILRGAH